MYIIIIIMCAPFDLTNSWGGGGGGGVQNSVSAIQFQLGV